MTESREEARRKAEAVKDTERELEGLVPVKMTVGPNLGIVYSLRFSADEITYLREAAESRGVKLSELIREAALQSAAREKNTPSPRDEALKEARDLVGAAARALDKDREALTVRLALLVSGGGTTLQNFLDVIAARKLDARIEVVVSSMTNAYALERAHIAGIPTHVLRRRDYDSQDAFSDAITAVLDRYEVDLVLGAGFLQRYLFPKRFEGRMLNVHPGLLPQFGGRGMYGHHVHEAVLAAGESESGCSVIIADHEYDHGPTIVERRVAVLPEDTPETLAARIFEAECEAYPEAVRIVAQRLGLTV